MFDDKIQNLPSLLENYIICFPAIQREYIQGSNSNKIKKLRDKLINEIIDALKSDTDKRLNIIYGYSNNYIFYPIDGQQRLTTLYILYWFLALKAGKIDSIVFKKPVSYEVRPSSKDFFIALCEECNQTDLLNSLKSGDFLSSIVNNKWFKSSWLEDNTVLSIINVITEFINNPNISNDENDEYERCYKNFHRIKFDFICKETEIAEDESIISYIKLNSRGKQLSDFDNIKSLLYTLELLANKKDNLNSFSYEYDFEYIDIFFNQQNNNADLDELTDKINTHTINFLINSLNIILYLKDNNFLEIKTIDEYIDNINKFICNYSSQESVIEEYFKFIKNILNFLNDNQSRVELIEFTNLTSSIISKNELCNDNGNNIAKMLYINGLLYPPNRPFDYIEKEVTILNYTLLNLNYVLWKDKLNLINNIINQICNYNGIIDFFVCENNNIYNILDNNMQIKNRIDEQVIKYKIIKHNDLEYNYFEELEKIFPKYRTVYFLLYFLYAYTFQTTEEFKSCLPLLEKYKKIAQTLYKQNNNELKYKFAIATYYANDNLLSSEIINQQAGSRYIVDKRKNGSNILDTNALHYWIDDYYRIDTVKKEMQNIKLNKLKLLYDLIVDDKIDDLYHILEGESYVNCWLRYAIEHCKNKNDTCLLDRKLSFVDNKVYLQTDNMYSINFFAYYYYLCNYNKSNSQGCIYNITTRNTRDTQEYDEQYTNYNKNVKNIEGYFMPKTIIWQSEKEIYKQGRRFYYSLFKLKVPINNDSIFCIENNTIKKFQFTNLQYTEKSFSISEYAQRYAQLLDTNNNLVLGFYDKSDEEFKKLEYENFIVCKDYTYNYENIVKLISRNSTEEILDI